MVELALVTENVQEIIDKAIECGAIIEEKPIEKSWARQFVTSETLMDFCLKYVHQ